MFLADKAPLVPICASFFCMKILALRCHWVEFFVLPLLTAMDTCVWACPALLSFPAGHPDGLHVSPPPQRCQKLAGSGNQWWRGGYVLWVCLMLYLHLKIILTVTKTRINRWTPLEECERAIGWVAGLGDPQDQRSGVGTEGGLRRWLLWNQRTIQSDPSWEEKVARCSHTDQLPNAASSSFSLEAVPLMPRPRLNSPCGFLLLKNILCAGKCAFLFSFAFLLLSLFFLLWIVLVKIVTNI